MSNCNKNIDEIEKGYPTSECKNCDCNVYESGIQTCLKLNEYIDSITRNNDTL